MKPYEAAESLDTLIFGDMVCPGIVRIEGLMTSDPKWENRKAAGNLGANTVLHGDDPREFTAVVKLSGDQLDEENDEFDRWIDFTTLVMSTTSGATPFALPIYHPDIAGARITEAVNRGVSALVYDGLGGAEGRIKFGEFRPLKRKPPESAEARQGRPDRPDPNAARKAELEAALAEASAP